MIVTKKDPLSGEVNSIEIPITENELARCNARHKNEEYIQDILPHLSEGQREFLMTGITESTWKAYFPTLKAYFGRDKMSNNLPDDWNTHYRTCPKCKKKYHASDRGCFKCVESHTKKPTKRRNN